MSLPAFGLRSRFFLGLRRGPVTESRQQSMGPAGKLINIRQGEGSIEEYAGHFWEVRSAIGDREDLPPGLLLGGASRASQSPNAVLEPRGVIGGLP